MNDNLRISTDQLIKMLEDARARTLELVCDLDDEQMIGPCLSIVNPPLWEIGHVAWFQENWALRHLRKQAPLRANADALYDSAAVAHETRWNLPLPSRLDTLAYMEEVLDSVISRLHTDPLSDDEIYFHLLPVFHEDMHAEAITYTRQTLGYPPPCISPSPEARESGDGSRSYERSGGPLHGDTEIPGGKFMLGGTPDLPFVFDNEKWAHAVDIAPFRIALAPVTNAEFAAFVDDGGYVQDQWWSETGRCWKEKAGAEFPVYWLRAAGGRWLNRNFDALLPLEDNLPVIHVNWYEAEAYCRWARRRLPTEAEWEMAASAEPATSRKRIFPWGNKPPTPERANVDGLALRCIEVGALPAGDSAFGCRQMIGNVWEWMTDDFLPYPGFVIDPYKEYSAPWFGNHKVLRGGCWTTRSRLIRNSWRNFYTPDRRDVWAGFRTCALNPPTP